MALARPWRSTRASRHFDDAASARPVIGFFLHLAKCAGTSIREAFIGSGAWAAVPYCVSSVVALRQLRQTLERRDAPFILWEQHCRPNVHRASQTIAALQSLPHTPAVASFTILRHPADLARSVHRYFHRKKAPPELWLRQNAEVLLFDKGLMGFAEPGHWNRSNGPLPTALCDYYVAEALRQLDALDWVGFVEEPQTLQPIMALAGLPFRAARQLPRILPEGGSSCRDCHQFATNGTVARRGRALQLSALAARMNRCSTLVYRHARARWARRDGERWLAARNGSATIPASRARANDTFEQVASSGACCKDSSADMRAISSNGLHATPGSCEVRCLEDDSCSHFSHSRYWRNCILCASCRDLSTSGTSWRYTSWRRAKNVLRTPQLTRL